MILEVDGTFNLEHLAGAWNRSFEVRTSCRSVGAPGRLLTDGLTGLVKDCSTPARVRVIARSHCGLTGRCWTILKGGNREGVLTEVSRCDGLWGFERLRCGVS